MNVPIKIRAGDTIKWTENAPVNSSGDSLPSSAWTLKLELQGPGRYTVTASASGDGYQFTIQVGVSKTFRPGIYRWLGFCEKTSDQSERYQIGAGTVHILPNLALTQEGADGRSHVRRMVDKIADAIEVWADKPGQITIGTGIGSQTVVYKTLPDLIKAKSTYDELLKQEEAAEAIANGQTPRGHRILTRFSVPQ